MKGYIKTTGRGILTMGKGEVFINGRFLEMVKTENDAKRTARGSRVKIEISLLPFLLLNFIKNNVGKKVRCSIIRRCTDKKIISTSTIELVTGRKRNREKRVS